MAKSLRAHQMIWWSPRLVSRATMKQHARVYQTNMAMGASTLQRVIATYNVAIAACRNKNSKRVREALCLLLQSIRSSADKDLANQLCLFYTDCGAMIQQQRYAEVETMLFAVRETWSHINTELKESKPSCTTQTSGSIELNTNSEHAVPFTAEG